jgi:hypothetical protein
MALRKKLWRGKATKQVTFCANAVDSIARLSSIDTETTVSHEGAVRTNSAACREPGIIKLNNTDPYGCLELRPGQTTRRTPGAFLTRNVERGEVLALLTRTIIPEQDQYDGRERRFIAHGKNSKGETLVGDGISGREYGSYARDHPTMPSQANTRVEANDHGLVLVATTQILKGQEAFRNYGLEHYLHEMRSSKKCTALLMSRYYPDIPVHLRHEWVTRWLEERAHLTSTPPSDYWYDGRGRHSERTLRDEQEENLPNILDSLEETTKRFEARLAQQAHLRRPLPMPPPNRVAEPNWTELERMGRKTTLYAVTESNARFTEDALISINQMEANLKVATLNIRILSDDKLDAIVLYIVQNDIDILFLQDTRAHDGRSLYFAEQMQAKLHSKLNKDQSLRGVNSSWLVGKLLSLDIRSDPT